METNSGPAVESDTEGTAVVRINENTNGNGLNQTIEKTGQVVTLAYRSLLQDKNSALVWPTPVFVLMDTDPASSGRTLGLNVLLCVTKLPFNPQTSAVFLVYSQERS